MTKKDKFILLVQTYAISAVSANYVTFGRDGRSVSACSKSAAKAVLCAAELKARHIPFDTKDPNKLLEAVHEFCEWVFSQENPHCKPSWLP